MTNFAQKRFELGREAAYLANDAFDEAERALDNPEKTDSLNAYSNARALKDMADMALGFFMPYGPRDRGFDAHLAQLMEDVDINEGYIPIE